MSALIKQRFDGELQRKDCFLCCAAMATDHSYDDAWAKLDDDLRAVLAPDQRGPYGDMCDRILKALGYLKADVQPRNPIPQGETGDYFLLFILPEYASTGFLRNMLWGRRALLQVRSKNYAGEHHIIYWSGSELHDPSNARCYEWPEVEPIYVWLFNEVLHVNHILTELRE